MNDEDDDYRAPTHWGDMGALVLAGGFSLFGLYLVVTMLTGGHPLAVLFRTPQEAPPARLSQAEWNEKKFNTTPGEVILSTSTARPPASAAPPVKDWSSLRIRLERTACPGGCPSYSVEIAGDGAVVYEGRACVAAKGERRAAIPVADVRNLFAKLQVMGYFTLRDAYFSSPIDSSGVATGNPRYTVAIAFDGAKKTVNDVAGESAGMPHKVTMLEDAIDAAAGTKRWISGPDASCRKLPLKPGP
jgi:hypothetical protein